MNRKAGPKVAHTMTEDEQAAIIAEIRKLSQPMGPKSTELLAATKEFTLTFELNGLMLVLPEWIEVTVLARKTSDGKMYYVAGFEYDEDLKDYFEEINMQVFKERLARHVIQNGEDIFLSGHNLDWRE